MLKYSLCQQTNSLFHDSLFAISSSRLDEQDDSTGINENFIPFNNERIELEPHICWMRDAASFGRLLRV